MRTAGSFLVKLHKNGLIYSKALEIRWKKSLFFSGYYFIAIVYPRTLLSLAHIFSAKETIRWISEEQWIDHEFKVHNNTERNFTVLAIPLLVNI